MEQITNNFTLEEFTRSETASRMGIQNVPGNREKLAIVNLCAKLLQPLRDIYGKPIRINSGYRCPELNKAVGGVPNSQHVLGEAADIHCEGWTSTSASNTRPLFIYPTSWMVRTGGSF